MEKHEYGFIFIKYDGIDASDKGSVDLSSLGTSLVGFDKLLREIIKISRIQNEISIKVSTINKGSVIVDVLLDIKTFFQQLPFDNPDDLIDFLRVVDESLWFQAVAYFQDIRNTVKTVYDFLTSHPIELVVVSRFVEYLVSKASKCKNKQTLDSSELPKRIAEELHRLIQKRHLFRKPLKPIIDENVSSISISTDRSFKKKTTINEDNFHEYLGDDDKILEHLNNGEIHHLCGEITSLKSTRGDSLTFKYPYKNRNYNLDLLPPDGSTTKKYTDFYKEKVIIDAEIIRDSMYKKPKLKLESIDFHQKKLFHHSKENNAKTTTQ